MDWLKIKGIDEGTRDKFTGTCILSECEFVVLTFRFAEQDITGDVFLELDLELLKTEIGIVAFGKRKRIVNIITELKTPATKPESTAHSESLFSHSRSISSAQGSSLNSLSLSPTAPPPISATGSLPLGGFYQSGSPRTVDETYSPLPETPQSSRRVSDPVSIHDNLEALNRASSRNSFIGLGIQFTSKFQVSAVWGKVEGEILTTIGVYRRPDHRS